MNVRTFNIARLNDHVRINFLGGRIMTTKGVQALDPGTLREVVTKVRTFDDWNEDNDPHGEHDCASFYVKGVKYMFKIDYYDESLKGGAGDPANALTTRRVLTIMRADEY